MLKTSKQWCYNDRLNSFFDPFLKHLYTRNLLQKEMSFIYAQQSQYQRSQHEEREEMGRSGGKEGWWGCKREVLKDVNRMYRNEMDLMGRTLQEAQRRYREEDTGKNEHRITFFQTKSTYFEDGFLKSQTQGCCYEQAVVDQQSITKEIGNIKNMLASRIGPFAEVEIERLPEQRSQVNWDLLMSNSTRDQPLRSLFKASLKKEGNSQAYIAYTEQSSIREKPPTTFIPSNSMKRPKKATLPGPTSDERHRLYQDIHTRIANSPCTMTTAIHSKQTDKTLHLFTRLSREKQQRQSLLNRIKLQLK